MFEEQINLQRSQKQQPWSAALIRNGRWSRIGALPASEPASPLGFIGYSREQTLPRILPQHSHTLQHTPVPFLLPKDLVLLRPALVQRLQIDAELEVVPHPLQRARSLCLPGREDGRIVQVRRRLAEEDDPVRETEGVFCRGERRRAGVGEGVVRPAEGLACREDVERGG